MKQFGTSPFDRERVFEVKYAKQIYVNLVGSKPGIPGKDPSSYLMKMISQDLTRNI